MTDFEKAQIEFDAVGKWVLAEEDKLAAQIKSEGKKVGLDTNNYRYKPIYDEAKRRIKEIKEKYGIA
ncbi:MAG: hypothetical protein IJ741_03620 [Schwartzia sp.]|nr:hypothetical protein [Schwartzia sp. (in: firmicutes)]